MAGSKRAARSKRKGERAERLTPANFVANALAVFVGVPALVVGAALLFMGHFCDENCRKLNQNLFLGAVMLLIAVFLLLLSGFKVRDHLKARRRFRELLEGDKKSAVAQNLDELTTLARALGPRYRKELEKRLAERGIRR